MWRNRIILIISATVLTVALFLLPKVVVDNEQEDINTTSGNEHSDEESNVPEFDHGNKSDSATSLLISEARDLFRNSENIEKSLTFADSLALLYEKSGKYDSAAYFYGWIADKSPNVEREIRAGIAYYEAFGYAVDDGKAKFLGEKTRLYLGKVLEDHPEMVHLKTKIGMTYISTNNPMQGIMMLREVVASDPTNEEALFNLGLLSRQSGQNDKAIERFATLLEAHPENIQARFLLGLTYMDIGKNKEAIEQFEIVKKKGNDPAITATVDGYLEEIK